VVVQGASKKRCKQLKNSIGVIEFRCIANGIEAADGIVKAGPVELLTATIICPGRFIVLVAGEVGAVTAAISWGKNNYSTEVVCDTVIPHVHPEIIRALRKETKLGDRPQALGVVETSAVTPCILAADAAVKGANISLHRIVVARHLGGKAVAVFTGAVSAVQTAVQQATAAAGKKLVATAVVPSPATQLWERLLRRGVV